MIDLHVTLQQPSGTHPRQAIDAFLPQASERCLTICLHGGWWTQGRREDLRPLCLLLAEHGLPSATVGYRLLGDGCRQGQEIVDDCIAGIRAALELASLHGADASSAILLGSGSGSLLALTVAAQLATAPACRVRAVVACGVTPTLEPWEGCPGAVARALEQFAGSQRHALSPLHLPSESLPPLLLLHGDADAEVPARLAQRLHARAIEAGEHSQLAVLSGPGHQFIEAVQERGARAGLERILPFLADLSQPWREDLLFSGRGEAATGAEQDV
jgi:acetyl esterase/lipase